MNQKELQQQAGLVMAAAKTKLEISGCADPIMMLHWPLDLASIRRPQHPIITPGEWSRFPCPGEVLNDGPAKTEYFESLRQLVRFTRADATIFCTDAIGARLTPEGAKQFRKMRGEVDQGFERLVKLGWATREECIMLTGQTKTDVVIMKHAYRRHDKLQTIEWIGSTVSSCGSQSGFGGRQKMFAIGPDSDLGEPPEGSYAEEHNKTGRKQ